MSVVRTTGYLARQIAEITHPDPVVRVRKWAEAYSKGASYCPIAKATLEIIEELERRRGGNPPDFTIYVEKDQVSINSANISGGRVYYGNEHRTLQFGDQFRIPRHTLFSLDLHPSDPRGNT